MLALFLLVIKRSAKGNITNKSALFIIPIRISEEVRVVRRSGIMNGDGTGCIESVRATHSSTQTSKHQKGSMHGVYVDRNADFTG